MPQRLFMMSALNTFMVMLLIATSLLSAAPTAQAAPGLSAVDVSQSIAPTDQPMAVESIIGPSNNGSLAQTTNVSLTLSTNQGAAGTVVNWTVRGYIPAGEYFLNGPCQIATAPCSIYKTFDFATPQTYLSGSARVYFAEPGPSSFTFRSGYTNNSIELARAPFTVLPTTPRIQVTSGTHLPGANITVTGSGFNSSEPVEIRWGSSNGVQLASGSPDSQYRFSTSIRIPSYASGSVQIYARSHYSGSTATTTVSVRPNYIDRGTLRLTPSTGPSGQYTAVYGTGFSPGEIVDIRWQSDTGPIIGSMTVRYDGTYLGRITTRTGPPGSNRVYATGRTSLYRSLAWYQITSSTPTMSLRSSHTLVQSGAVVTISGSGYQPNELVHIRWISQGGTLLGSVRASSSGAISGRITVPQAANKNYQVFATGGTSKRYGSVVLQVRNYARTSSTLVSPNFGRSGEVVIVRGGGYQSGERIAIRWGSFGGPVLGYVTADYNGSYAGRVTIPAATAGTYNVVTVGQSSYRYSTAPYTITSAASSGQLNVSHVNVRPGYVILSNGTGWTPGQQLELRWNGANGPLMGRLTVRSNGTWSGRITIPTTAKPGTYYLYAITPSGFTSVRISVSGTTIQGSRMVEDFETAKAMPTPTVTPTATPMGTPSVAATPQITAEPTEIVGTPSASPTEPVGTPQVTEWPTETIGTPQVTEVPSEIPGTPQSTDGATEEPTEIPGTPSAEPTEEPTEKPTEVPTEEPVVVITGTLTIRRQDSNGSLVAGACYQLLDSAGSVVDTTCDTNLGSAGDGITEVQNLPVGSYTLREVTTPAGYDVVVDIPVQVSDGMSIVYVIGALIPTPEPTPTPQPTAIPTEVIEPPESDPSSTPAA